MGLSEILKLDVYDDKADGGQRGPERHGAA